MTEEVRKRKGHESFQTKLKIPLRPPSPFYPELSVQSNSTLQTSALYIEIQIPRYIGQTYLLSWEFKNPFHSFFILSD